MATETGAAPLVVAHRGASAAQAEHTLAAYVMAIEQGADALECDVRLTRDGHLVCVHDRRVDRTSNGAGPVSELDLARLRALDFASWQTAKPAESGPQTAKPADSGPQTAKPGPGLSPASGVPAGTGELRNDAPGDEPYLAGVAPDRETADGGVLTLDRLLQLVADTTRPVGLYVETKHPTRYAGLVEKELVRRLTRFGWDGRRPAGRNRVTVMSFAPIALRRVRLLAPQLATTLLLERPPPTQRLRGGRLPAGVTNAGPGLDLLRGDPGLVARAHEQGLGVYTWTIDRPEDIAFVRSLGVDAIGTNRPADTRAALSA